MEETLEIADSETRLALRAHRWSEAAKALRAIPRRNSAGEFQLRLSRNLADLAQHRPEIYRVLIDALPNANENFSVVRGKLGRWTIAAQSESSTPQYLSRHGDPVAATMQSLTELKPALKSGRPLALCSLGDGHLLAALAAFSPPLLLGRQQAVYLIEPRADLLLTILMLHDFSGTTGPIQQKRFYWSAGPDWPEQFRQMFLSDPFSGFPDHQIFQGADTAAIEAVFRKTVSELLELDQQCAARVEAIYAKKTGAELAELFGPNPPRPPRVLLFSSRFTTVIQYSLADAAEAFAKLGWQTRTLIEPSNYQTTRKVATRLAIADFQPDLIFLIDHLRHEYDGVCPENLPFACWIQDHLPNLCDAKSAAELKKRDFVLTGIGTHFVQQYGYPARQIVDLPNLARVPKRPATWQTDGLDLVYISNWSRTTEQVINEIAAKTAAPPEMRAIADACIARITAVYDQGECLSTQRDIRVIVAQSQQDCGVAISDPILLDGAINFLWDRLNNHLYRRQALLWIAELAERKNLSFGLYGRGWENHPQLHKFARGVVTPGQDLETLVRKTKINLQLEPFACFTHPRLLSGLFAGGFFLIRDHPFNHLPQRLLDFLCQNLPDTVETTDQARAAISSDKRQALESVLQQCSSMSEQADPVQMARNWHRAGLLRPGNSPVNNLTDVIFSNPAGLERNVSRFLADEDLRRRVGQALRQDLESRLSYESGLSRACRRMGELLGTES